MRLQHHDLVFNVPDEWWSAAGMIDFSAGVQHHYSAGSCNWPTEIIAIESIEPVRREIGLFQSRDRTVSILTAIRNHIPLPPIGVHSRRISSPAGRRRLYEGVHRLYCSIACGLTHVPAYEASDELYCPPSPDSQSDSQTVGLG